MRVGVEIANKDEVGVLEFVRLQDRLDQISSEQNDFHRTIMAALLAQVKEDTTLNKAATQLAWGGHMAFEKYRVVDPRNGKNRSSTTLRTQIETSCRANVTVMTGSEMCGFFVDEKVAPAMIRRFARPITASDIASQPPENFENLEEVYEF